jgi:hypothetical protein
VPRHASGVTVDAARQARTPPLPGEAAPRPPARPQANRAARGQEIRGHAGGLPVIGLRRRMPPAYRRIGERRSGGRGGGTGRSLTGFGRRCPEPAAAAMARASPERARRGRLDR